jgi:hypothetical protein
MKLVRTLFLVVAFVLPVSWTVARAADEAPAEGAPAETKKEKKTKKGKKADKEKAPEGEKKAE